MFKAKIEVGYVDDWSVDMMEKFNCEMESIYCQNINPNEVIDIIKIKNNSEFEEKFNSFFKKYDYIKEFEIIDKTENFLFFKIVTICESNNEKFVKNHCYQIGSIIFKNRKESWTVISNDKDNFKKLLNSLNESKNRNAKLIFLKNYNFDKDELTQRQFSVIEFLFQRGYFEIPKKITLEMAAKELNTTKSNLNVHLNKVVNKLILNLQN